MSARIFCCRLPECIALSVRHLENNMNIMGILNPSPLQALDNVTKAVDGLDSALHSVDSALHNVDNALQGGLNSFGTVMKLGVNLAVGGAFGGAAGGLAQLGSTVITSLGSSGTPGLYHNQLMPNPQLLPQQGSLTVNGNTVNTGRYTIMASNSNDGSLSVRDNINGESFNVWGDPHITTDKGDSTSFQHAPATFLLPDGTKITVDPTQGNGDANYINNVTITKGNDAVEMAGFRGNLQTQALPGEGNYLDNATPDGTVITTVNGNLDQLQLPDGTLISGNNVANIDSYANQSQNTGQTLIDEGHQLVQEGLQLIQQGNVQQGMQLIQDGAALEMQGGQSTGQGASGGVVANAQPVSSNTANAATSGGQAQATNGTDAANANGSATPAHYFATTNAADLPPNIQAALSRYQSDLGKVYGSGAYRGQCAQLTEALSGVGTTPTWKQGVQVRGNTSLAPGTPIATFNYNWGGRARYGSEAQPVGVSGMSHTGIYLGQDANGLYMLNQWNSNGHCSGATVSYYPWDSNAGHNGAEGGSHYYTISA